MSRGRSRFSKAYIARAIIAVLAASVINIGVPAFAEDTASLTSPASPSTRDSTTVVPAIARADKGSGAMRSWFQWPVSVDVRLPTRVAQRSFFAQSAESSSVDHSGRWCAGGLALVAAGVAAAVVSESRRHYNAQKPDPPVGFVLGTAAGVVGGIQMIRKC